MKEMFCFQCQQTAHNTGCDGKVGVCGKKADTANYQDELAGALITLAKTGKKSPDTDLLMMKGLFTTVTNVSFNDRTINELISKIQKESGSSESFDMKKIWNADEDIRSLKSLILFGVKGMAAYAYHAYVLGKTDSEVTDFFYTALRSLSEEESSEKLLKLVLKTGKVNLRCMAMLDEANTEAYGEPVPTEVPLTIEKGPFIVVSGHDLHDMKLLLEQTEGKGINIYTHSEMLPAHGYPELKKYPHLKGNFGTGWQNQQSEFHNIPAPILFTTNCIMPVRQSYCDRVFTTSVVSYPELVHIGDDKDFTPVIEKALECGGYDEDREMTGMNGGKTVVTGFARNAVLANADKIIDLVKRGKIRHFFLIGGCDGASPSRSYFTDFAKLTPPDTVILTLACGKYRLNDLDLGEIEGIPRILDCGQCNDAYSAVVIAAALAKAFDCTVNDLPLTLVLSWFEQKAVCILLTLLYLGIKNIYLGPTLPAFISSNVMKILQEKFSLTPISKPEKDLEKILGK
ncbi:MAG: hydroxylamine reductase [Oscillospiraceae bacterium]|nr:hydroxylamine reductase [Oscillospiraceae bacterium]